MRIMKKKKFTLTPDLIDLEKEPFRNDSVPAKIDKKEKKLSKKDQMNIRIDSYTKKIFQIWCFENGKQMSDVIEGLIIKLMKTEQKL
ncbi:MAG: hypothetical protein FADNKDHG_01449 [Holosporales bacterium]